MREEIITSGRMNPNVDPILTVWHWEIPVYLFLGGLAAGLLFFAALYAILDKNEKFQTTIKWAPFLAPVALMLGLVALFLDLRHKLFFWQLYTTIRLESPMSWGAWTLMVITPISFLWAGSFLRELYPQLKYPLKVLNTIETWVINQRKNIAWVMIVFAVILGVYTGILLSAFNARPLWNNPILGPLFLVSGLSTAAATIMWMSKNEEERKIFSRIDLLLILIELFLIVHMFMGLLAGSTVQIESAKLFLGGEFTLEFWGFVVLIGLVIPASLEVMELRGLHIPVAIPSALILFGGFLFRIVMVEAGQLTRYLY